MRIAISLLSIKHKVTGGIESFTRNLLDGLVKSLDANQYVLLCSRDNIDSFRMYEQSPNIDLVECPVESINVGRAILYECTKLDRKVTEIGADFCFVPNARIPMLWHKNRYLIVMHDVKVFSFPSVWSSAKSLMLKLSLRMYARNADEIIAISNFVKHDIIKYLGVEDNRITVIYNPIPQPSEFTDFTILSEKYGIEKEQYFYSVATCLEHKNLLTLLEVMNYAIENNVHGIPQKLVISGATYNNDYTLRVNNFIRDHHLESNCIFTGFISNSERNTLIRDSASFLFPSTFEGFGMPVIEAMQIGTPVVTTRCTSIPEVSKNKANYVNNPYDVLNWVEVIQSAMLKGRIKYYFEEYSEDNVTKEYVDLFTRFKISRHG